MFTSNALEYWGNDLKIWKRVYIIVDAYVQNVKARKIMIFSFEVRLYLGKKWEPHISDVKDKKILLIKI